MTFTAVGAFEPQSSVSEPMCSLALSVHPTLVLRSHCVMVEKAQLFCTVSAAVVLLLSLDYFFIRRLP